MIPSVARLLRATSRQSAAPPPSSSLSGPAPLLRALWRSTAQPVAVITAYIPSISIHSPSSSTSANHGATLSSLSSISLSPPLVAFSLRLPSTLATYLLAESIPPPNFKVHLLSSTQEPVARAFARQEPLPAPASPSPPPASVTAPPSSASHHFPPELFQDLERDNLGYLECSVVRTISLAELGEGEVKEGGPRSQLFIARVEGSQVPSEEVGREKGSLVYWEQGYHNVGGN
ncbi:hypothetical protein P7C70_g5980, partial [Phenoliferia sp. Uapishka_3]